MSYEKTELQSLKPVPAKSESWWSCRLVEKKIARAKDIWLTTFRNGENVAVLYRDGQGVIVYWSLQRNGVHKRHFPNKQDAIEFAKEIIAPRSTALHLTSPSSS